MAASVRLYGLPVGILDVAKDGRLSFQYEGMPDIKHPLSLGMPYTETRYDHDQAGPFFDGLLPDNTNVRKKLASHFQIDVSDDYGLLFELGADCPGAITIHPIAAEVIPESKVTPEFQIMTDAKLAQHIRELPQKPLFVDVDGEIRLSLAGVHNKAALVLVKNQLALPKGRTPTTHIVKVDIDGLPDTVKVEHFCLQIANELGIDAVKSDVKQVEDLTFLLINRYDRTIGEIDGTRYVRRLHQEDFCQALGRFPREKYEKDGGPGWKECFELMRRTTDPATSITELLKRAIFQFLIGNPDAHAKNYSLVYKGDQIHLSRLYDVNNAAAFREHYKEQRPRLAMFVGGERDPSVLTAENWTIFAKEIGVTSDLVHAEIKNLARTMIEKIALVRERVRGTVADTRLCDLVVEDVTSRCRHILNWYS